MLSHFYHDNLHFFDCVNLLLENSSNYKTNDVIKYCKEYEDKLEQITIKIMKNEAKLEDGELNKILSLQFKVKQLLFKVDKPVENETENDESKSRKSSNRESTQDPVNPDKQDEKNENDEQLNSPIIKKSKIVYLDVLTPEMKHRISVFNRLGVSNCTDKS